MIKRKTQEEYAASIEDRYPGLLTKVREMPQRDVAKHYGISAERVRQFRLRLDIPAFCQRPNEEKFEEAKTLVGMMPDQEVADRLGISPTTVWSWRRSMGIEPFKELNTDTARVAAEAHRIGKETDYAIAKSLGVHQQIVQRLRKKLGIKAVGATNNPTGKRKKRKDIE